MSRTSIPQPSPPPQKTTAVRRVLGMIRGKGKSPPPQSPPPPPPVQTPPPSRTPPPVPPRTSVQPPTSVQQPTTNKVTIGSNRDRSNTTVTPPTPTVDPNKLIKDRIEQARRELSLLKTYAFAPPAKVDEKLKASDDLVKRATKPEDFGAALQALNEGLKFAPAMKGFAEDRTPAVAAQEEVAKLPFAKHTAMIAPVAHFGRCIKDADDRLVAAANPEAVEAPRLLLQGIVQSMLPEAVQLNGTLGAADGAIKKAEGELAKWVDYQFLDLSAAKTKVESARAAFDRATTGEQATAATKELSGFAEAIKAAKGAGKEGIKASESYASTRKSLMDEVAEAAKLRGANSDPALMKLIADAKTAVAVGDSLLAAAKTPNEVEIAERTLTTEAGLLKRCKKLSEDLKKKAEADNKAIPKYQTAYQLLKEARAKIAVLPGTTAQLKEADALLAQYRIATNGEPASGYATAVEALEGKAERLLAAAQEAAQTFATQQMDPDVKAALGTANQTLEIHERSLPRYRNDVQRLAVASAASDPEKNTALRRLAELTSLMDREITTADNLKKDAMAKAKTAFGIIKQLKEKNAPAASYEALEKVYNERVMTAMAARDFEIAIPLLDEIAADAGKFLASFENDFAAWTGAKRRLGEIEARAIKVMNWPPLAGSALALRDDLRELIATTEKELTYAAGAAKLPAFETRLTNLNAEATKQNLGDDAKIDDFARFRASRREGIEFEKKAAETALLSLEQKLAEAGIKSVKATAAHKVLADALKAWLVALDHPVLKPGDDPKRILAEHYTKAYNEIRRAAQMAKDMAANPNQLQAAVGEAKKSDARGAVRDIFNDIHRMLNELEALGVDVSKDRALIAPTLDDSQITENLGKFLIQFQKGVKFSHDQALAKLNARKEASSKQLKDLRKGLKSGYDHDFKDYFDELTAQIDDAEAMLGGTDPTLVAAAESEIATLHKALSDTAPDKNDPDKKTFKDVIALWKTISKRLGDGERMKKRMHETYNRLRDKLNETIADAKKIPPAEAWAALSAVGDEIEKAAQAAEVQDELYKKFEAKYEEIQLPNVRKPTTWLETDKISQVRKHTSTSITDRTAAYIAKIETSLAEAKELAETEGRIHDGIKRLDAIEKELDDLLSMEPEDARVAVQEKDAEATQEQRMLRDMCRQWEREVTWVVDTVLPETEKAMSKAKESDKSQLSDLKKEVERAGKPLEPYLDLISALPHKKLGANASPNMQKAAAAFGQARQQLENLVRSARRLAGNPEGTNIDFEGDLKKVNAEWASRAERLQAALEALAQEIAAVPAQADTDPNEPETYLAPNDQSVLSESAGKLARSIRTLGSRFKPDAFDRPMAVLTNKKATQEQKLTAREEALRTMRLLKADLVDNKLVQTLFQTKDNLFRDVRPEFGLARAGLKKIEIEVLVGV